MAYSVDLRERVAQAHAESESSAEVAETHGCSESWVRRVTADDQRAFDDEDEAKIRALIKRTPDATLAEVAEAIGKPACPGTVSRTLKRLNLPRKKSRRTPRSGTAPTS